MEAGATLPLLSWTGGSDQSELRGQSSGPQFAQWGQARLNIPELKSQTHSCGEDSRFSRLEKNGCHGQKAAAMLVQFRQLRNPSLMKWKRLDGAN